MESALIQLALNGGSGLITAVIVVYVMTKRNTERIDKLETGNEACKKNCETKIDVVHNRITDDYKGISTQLTQIQVSVAHIEGANNLADKIAAAIVDFTKTQRIKMSDQ